MSLTLEEIHRFAYRWAPIKGRWSSLLEDMNTWGPAHELGHALIEPRSRWRLQNYGHCSLSNCRCRGELCDAYECAAMTISGRLLKSAGCEDLFNREVDDTIDIDRIDAIHWKNARVLLRKKGLWPVPRSATSLEAALKRRLGKPRGTRRPPPPYQPSALGMFSNMLFNPHS